MPLITNFGSQYYQLLYKCIRKQSLKNNFTLINALKSTSMVTDNSCIILLNNI